LTVQLVQRGTAALQLPGSHMGTAARLGSRNTRYIYNMYADKQQNSSACQKLDAAFSHNGLTRVAVHGDVHGGHCMAVHLLA
jgi:hypothetical protein